MKTVKILVLIVVASLVAVCAYAQYSDYRSKRQMNVQPNLASPRSSGVLKFGYQQAAPPVPPPSEILPGKTPVYTPEQLDLTSPSREGVVTGAETFTGEGTTSSEEETVQPSTGPQYGRDLKY